ncbi:hypothetical protein BMS3Abin03_00234 [bacterium BMS3Abin03]|nr:hypothetical protein BMS3Abin03_00234 [bacterium BMS3Abin03]
MLYVFDVLLIIVLFALFGFLHSYLASEKVKQSFKKAFGKQIAFYRLGYNLFATASLYIIYELSPKPYIRIYDLPNPYDLIILIPQFLALAGLFWVSQYVCVKEFLGLSQIKRFFAGNYNSELDEDLTLTIGGPYKYLRHPVYFLLIMFLIFRPTMDLFYLTFLLCIIAYFYIGAYLEEKKMMKRFGKRYIKYKASVPMIFPVNFLKPYKPDNLSEA